MCAHHNANEILHENAVEYAKVAVESRCTQQQFLASLPWRNFSGYRAWVDQAQSGPPPPPPPRLSLG